MHSTALSLQADACFANRRELDRELARLAQKSGSLRFALGLGLDALARTGGHAQLGFSSIEDYGHERCERRRTWIGKSRAMARRVHELPCLRRALISGRISWSMAAELAHSATVDNEARLLQLAAGSTVARMKQLLRAQRSQSPSTDDALVEPDPLCTLTLEASPRRSTSATSPSESSRNGSGTLTAGVASATPPAGSTRANASA